MGRESQASQPPGLGSPTHRQVDGHRTSGGSVLGAWLSQAPGLPLSSLWAPSIFRSPCGCGEGSLQGHRPQHRSWFQAAPATPSPSSWPQPDRDQVLVWVPVLVPRSRPSLHPRSPWLRPQLAPALGMGPQPWSPGPPVPPSLPHQSPGPLPLGQG